MRKHLPMTLAALLAGALLFPTSAMAQSGEEIVNGGFGIGLGWASIEDGDSDILALVQYRGAAWEVEFNYIFGDSDAWALHGNYIWNFDRDMNQPDSGVYAGVGYTYVDAKSSGSTGGGSSSDNGINVLLGFDVDRNWALEGRYVFMDNKLFTVTVTYNFGGEERY